jgi:hypothetical protein
MFIDYVPRLNKEYKAYVPRSPTRNISSLYVPQFLEERKFRYVPQFPRNISSYVPRCHVAEEHNLCSSIPMSMRTYVCQDIFLGYVPQRTKEHKLCSSDINIYYSVFDRGTFVYFL